MLDVKEMSFNLKNTATSNINDNHANLLPENTKTLIKKFTIKFDISKDDLFVAPSTTRQRNRRTFSDENGQFNCLKFYFF